LFEKVHRTPGLSSDPFLLTQLLGLGLTGHLPASNNNMREGSGFFIFIFYIFVFYKNIFSIWKFTGIYPAAPLPGGQDLAARQRGGRGIFEKKNHGENCA